MRNILLSCFLCFPLALFGDNQTSTVSPVLPPTDLPFTISIEKSKLQLPNGWHSGAVGIHKDKCLLIAGRTNGLHGFSNNPNVNNFPPYTQNNTVYVIDFESGKIWSRTLQDSSAGLTDVVIDTLTVTSPESYQKGHTLYMVGGYGIDSSTNQMTTKSTLTAIDVPGLIHWVINPGKKRIASQYIRQTSDPLLQVTGGYMNQLGPEYPTLLIFGQNFTGLYNGNSNGIYTEQVRTFHIFDDGNRLSVVPTATQPAQNPVYRRRDLNVVPVWLAGKYTPYPAYMALSGVFTESGGIWTVPVKILPDGNSFMRDPQDPAAFKQAMNNYDSATIGLFSGQTQDMYVIVLGGMTYGFFQNGVFQTDAHIPFTNEVTTIKIDKDHNFTQYIMANQYPTIPAQFSHPGNPLLFGSDAAFVLKRDLPLYVNDVIALDQLKHKSHVLGYIIGGIESTSANTLTPAESAASPYIFKVKLDRVE